MSMGEAFRTCMRKYADFSGRARRSEYWWFYLALQLFMLPLNLVFIVTYVAFIMSVETSTEYDGTVRFSGGDFGPMVAVIVVMVLVAFGFALPSYAAQTRRLHDMGQSGLWVLLNFAGLGIVPTIMCIMETQPGTNQWGPDPKAAERASYGYPPSPGSPPSAPYPPAPASFPAYPTITPPDA
jgi:uncharacterized membrane protein YhaH (DUF805 family)